ncbi:MAG: SPASM domain-containing protein [Candidatus Gastranaerophilales bacterium]|nr:SPASM domain-containing protein [Candidatus Gastranaerophilales bacterium]
MTEKHAICTFPFDSAQISMQGDVFVCCPPWCNSYSFGNIYEQSFDEIWNGEKAKEFRRQFINENYNICNLDLCVKDCSHKIIPTEVVPKPKKFIFCYDSLCNVKCIFCRSCHQKQDLSYFDENMDSIIQNMLENAENVVLSGVGEALFSPHSRKLIKRISELFPNVKFSLISNGILCDKQNLEELGIIDKLISITVSLHATKKETYNKLVVNGDFDRVMNNLTFLSSLKKEGKLDRFILNFVVNAYNYKEMVLYMKMAQKIGATVGFLELLKLETNKDIYEKINIFDEKHPKFNDFVKVLKNPVFRSEICTINDTMLNLKPISLWEKLKYRFF